MLVKQKGVCVRDFRSTNGRLMREYLVHHGMNSLHPTIAILLHLLPPSSKHQFWQEKQAALTAELLRPPLFMRDVLWLEVD